MQMMPSSLQARIAQQQCRRTLARNQHLLGDCTDAFLDRLMIMLTEISLMPGECVLKMGEIARELSFASRGTIRVTDGRGTLIELINGEGTSPCVIGSVSFLMGMIFQQIFCFYAGVVRSRMSTFRAWVPWRQHRQPRCSGSSLKLRPHAITRLTEAQNIVAHAGCVRNVRRPCRCWLDKQPECAAGYWKSGSSRPGPSRV